jgi:hypothetical protein
LEDYRGKEETVEEITPLPVPSKIIVEDPMHI